MEARPVADEAMTVETAQAYQALCAFCSWALLADVGEEDVARLTAIARCSWSLRFRRWRLGLPKSWPVGWPRPTGKGARLRSRARRAWTEATCSTWSGRAVPLPTSRCTAPTTPPCTVRRRSRCARRTPPTAWHLGAAPTSLTTIWAWSCRSWPTCWAWPPRGRASLVAADAACDPAVSCDLAPDAACDSAALADAAAFLSNHVLVFSGIYLKNLRTRARRSTAPWPRSRRRRWRRWRPPWAPVPQKPWTRRGSRFPHSL